MKDLLKKLLVPVLSSRPLSALAKRLLGNGIPIFMLHRITLEDDVERGPVTPEHLRQCLDYLVNNGYTFISLEKLAGLLTGNEALPERAVVFTIDDGYADQAEITAPIFLEYECPATVFVISGMLDQSLWPWDAQVSWITENTRRAQLNTIINGQTVEVSMGGENGRRRARRILQNILRETPAAVVQEAVNSLAQAADIDVPSRPPDTYRPMDWDTARRLEKQGMQIAPHSVSHAILSKLEHASMEREIQESWAALERELEKPLKVFCYPTGRNEDYGQREIDVLKREGFICAVSTIPGQVSPGDMTSNMLYSLPRLPLPESMDDFIQYCSWIEHAKQVQRK